MSAKRPSLLQARKNLLSDIDLLAQARYEVGFLNGYRTAGKDSADIQQREKAGWNYISTRRQPAVDRAIRHYARAVRNSVKGEKG